MADLALYQYLLIGLLFVWSGFIRTGLGFGGAVLALPFLLLIVNDPLVFLPPIAIHLLIFSLWITYGKGIVSWLKGRKTDQPILKKSETDWNYLKKALKVMIIPKLIGVFGLLTLPSELMSIIIFFIVMVYAIGYVLNRPFRSKNKWVDRLFLALGGYVSGTSLIGAPLLVAVFSTHVAKHQLRDTLFALWFILVCIKMSSFLIAGVDLQLIHQLWLFPCAIIGHLIGMRFHLHLQNTDTIKFYRIIGVVLIVTSLVGMGSLLSGYL